MTEPLPPNSTIGIIGGGQLGRMLASSAARLGYRTIVLEPDTGAPAAQLCSGHIVAAYDDANALRQLADACDVITYEFENVPKAAADLIEGSNFLFPPGRALEVSQDRLVEKSTLQDAGIKVAGFAAIDSASDLERADAEFGGGVLKTRRFGYDGKGQKVLKAGEARDYSAILSELGNAPCILEELIDFQSEFSIIAARGRDGEIACFDPATNVHREGILSTSTVPASLSEEKAEDARRVAHVLLEQLNYVGVIGVEFFETSDGILVNEFAPRVHNSGHWTREACLVSQFEQHIRAICGLPLGTAGRHHDCVMYNLIGDDVLDLARWHADRDASLTLYGKAEARAGRKMGHVTKLGMPRS